MATAITRSSCSSSYILLKARIAQQQQLLDRLKKITAQCHGDNEPGCPIISAFTKE